MSEHRRPQQTPLDALTGHMRIVASSKSKLIVCTCENLYTPKQEPLGGKLIFSGPNELENLIKSLKPEAEDILREQQIRLGLRLLEWEEERVHDKFQQKILFQITGTLTQGPRE